MQVQEMKRGKTDRQTLDLNNWGVNDILTGAGCMRRILITAIGEESFLHREIDDTGQLGEECGNLVLTEREWNKVGEYRSYRVGYYLEPQTGDQALLSNSDAELKAKALTNADCKTPVAVWDNNGVMVALYFNNNKFIPSL